MRSVCGSLTSPTAISVFFIFTPRLNRPGLLQLFFHACPTLPRRFLRGARTAPMRLQANCEMVAIALQRLELPDPVDDPLAHGRPLVTLAVRFSYRIFTMTVTNAIFC